MKVKFLRSATAIVETDDVRILMDPWLVDGAYYGSWAHWPPYQWDADDFAGLTMIYVSHVHPDHCDRATMQRLDKRLPVLIHRYESPFLKRNIEALGFTVIELPHGTPYVVGNTKLSVYAADDCNPDVCGKFFNCRGLTGLRGSAQIDSLLHITDGKHHIINTNDCPYPLAKHVLPHLPQPDLLMTSYGAAGPYPQCFVSLTHEERLAQADKVKFRMLNQAISFAHDLKPRVTFPFAGQYVLSGRLAHLNPYLGLPEIDEIYWRMTEAGVPIVKIGRGATYDLATGKTDRDYVAADAEAKQRHIDDLSKRPFEFDTAPDLDKQAIGGLVRSATDRLNSKRLEHGIFSATTVIANGYELSMGLPPDGSYIKMDVDPRLFGLILSGPKYAHWNNAEIGSHISYDRRPDVFDRGIDNLMSFFHG